MSIKSLLYSFLFLLIITSTLNAQSTQFYQKRSWDSKRYIWKYQSSLSSSKAKKLKMYYEVHYNKQKKITVVKFPYYKKSSRSNNMLTGHSIEYYSNRQKVLQRDNFINKNIIGMYKFTYNNKGQPIQEEYFRFKKRQFVFKYLYKKNQLIKKVCYGGNRKQPVGTWLYYNKKNQIIKREKYKLNGEGKGKLALTTHLTYHNNGKIKIAKEYIAKKPYGNWYYYNKNSLLTKKEEYRSGILLRYYLYSYKKSNKLNMAILFEEGKPKERYHYNSKGKVVKVEIRSEKQ